jgi:hypothetical protein
MKSSRHTSNPSPALAGDSTAAAGVSTIHAPASPSGAKFFIRADGQYFVSMVFEDEDAIVKSGALVLKMVTRKIKTGCLGYDQNHLGVMLMMEEFFLN